MGIVRYCERYIYICLMIRFVFYKEVKKFVWDVIKVGIFYDLGLESNVDVCVIIKNRMDYIILFDEVNFNG